MKKIIVIGGGISGLATAALLGKEGFDVTLLEKNKTLGGRASVFEKKGFKFDMGPSWYMMPEVFEDFFGIFHHRTSDYFKLIKLEPRYRVYFQEKKFIDMSNDYSQNKKIFESFENESSERLDKYLKLSEESYNIILDKLLYRYYSSVLDLFDPEVFKNLLKLIFKINPFISFDNYTSKYFKSDELKKILEFPTAFLGGSPYNTPSLYSFFSHADFGVKIWYPNGGINMIIYALEKLCEEMKVRIKTNNFVKKILIKDKKAYAVETDKGTIKTDIVVSASDYANTELELLDKQWQSYPESYWNKRTMAFSTFIIYLGIEGKVKSIAHHNFYFSPFWKEHYDAVYKGKTTPVYPSYYFSSPSKSDKSVAPYGDENIFILVPLPPEIKLGEKNKIEFCDKIISHMEGVLNEKIKKRIVVKEIFFRNEFKDYFGAYKGTALGLAHTLKQSLMLRPKIKSKKVENLYFTGQYTQPGVGMPTVLISSQLTAGMVRKDNLKA